MGYRVCIDLMEGKGHCLFIENFYTGPRLLLDLLELGTYCVGTVRTNRKGFPKALVQRDTHASGWFRFATSKTGKLTAVWWRDLREVYALSTMHNTSTTAVMKRRRGLMRKYHFLVLQR